MLVPGHPADGQAGQRRVRPEGRRVDGAEAAARGPYLGEGPDRHPEELAQLLRPGALGDVQERGPRGVGHVGGENPAVRAAGEVPEEPGVHRAEGEVGAVRHAALGEEPVHLGGAEVGVEDQAGAPAHQGEVARRHQVVADRGGPAVLPDDRPVVGAPGAPVPGHHRLALVGDAQGGGPAPAPLQAAGHVGERLAHQRPDLVRVVLDPAGPGEVLGQLAVGPVDLGAAPVEDLGADAGGAGVDGDDHGVGGGHGGTIASGVAGDP